MPLISHLTTPDSVVQSRVETFQPPLTDRGFPGRGPQSEPALCLILSQGPDIDAGGSPLSSSAG